MLPATGLALGEVVLGQALLGDVREADVLRRALGSERSERRETEFARIHGLLVPVELAVSPLSDWSGQVVGASVIAHGGSGIPGLLPPDRLAAELAELRVGRRRRGLGARQFRSALSRRRKPLPRGSYSQRRNRGECPPTNREGLGR